MPRGLRRRQGSSPHADAGDEPDAVGTVTRMGWFARNNETAGPTAIEAEALWDAEPPLPGPDAPVLTIEDAFQVPGSGTVFTGRVESGTFRVGQLVVVQGKAGFARGTIAGISVGREQMEQVSVGKYASLNVPNLSVRVEILDLDAGCTITA